MKTTRKLLLVLAVFAACALLFAATALAAATVSDNNASVTVTKGIMLLNDEGGTYYSPNVTYTYTVAPAPATVTMPTVTDNSTPAVTATIKAGLPGSVSFTDTFTPCVTSKDVAFTSHATVFYTSAEAEGATPITENLTLNFNMSEFSAPGVYRYVLKDETSEATLNAAGIVRPEGYDDEVYLDVYVRNKTDGRGFEIYGAVLVTGDENVTPNTGKPASLDDDEYYTFNVEITKTTVGDTSHEFPFTIAVDNNTSGEPAANVTYYAGKDASDLSAGTAPSLTPSLKSGETYYIRGLIPQAKINVTETNDTSETYTVTAIAGDTTWINSEAVATNESASIAQTTQAVTDYPTDETAPTSVTQDATLKKIDFTNTYESISPTGLALRYGPFVLLLAGAVCFFIVGRKRKETKEESDSI